MNKKEKQMLEKHKNLIQSDFQKVSSHVQREENDWFINTIMIEGIDVPFKYKRKQLYKSLMGQRINITYYPHVENVAGFEIEVMNIVRIKVS